MYYKFSNQANYFRSVLKQLQNLNIDSKGSRSKTKYTDVNPFAPEAYASLANSFTKNLTV